MLLYNDILWVIIQSCYNKYGLLLINYVFINILISLGIIGIDRVLINYVLFKVRLFYNEWGE